MIWNRQEPPREARNLAPSLAEAPRAAPPPPAADAVEAPPPAGPDDEAVPPPVAPAPPAPAVPSGRGAAVLAADEARRLMPSRRLEEALRHIDRLVRDAAGRDEGRLAVPREVVDRARDGRLAREVGERLRAAGYAVREPGGAGGEAGGPLVVAWSGDGAADAGDEARQPGGAGR